MSDAAEERRGGGDGAALPSGTGHLPKGFPRRFPVRTDGRRPLRYRVVAALVRLAIRLIFGRKLKITGLDNFPGPEAGGFIIAVNHLSNLDPMMLGGFTPGANFAMAKRELYPNRFMAWIWGGCNTFPVDRGTADRWAMRTALDVLQRGGRLMVWVEGTRATSPGMKRAEPGVGFLLRRTGVPVLPVAVTGTEAALVKGRRLPRRVPATLHYGRPQRIDITGVRDNQVVADRVAALIAAELPPAYRGVYTGAVEAAEDQTVRAAEGAM